MRQIVDRNFLQSPKLREYLAASKKNCVVLTDYAAMEAFKGDALANISSAIELLCEFPGRVIVLKSTQSISTLKGRRCGFTRRMIDAELTKEFPNWCDGLAKAKAGDQDLQRQLLENGKHADAHLQRMADDQKTYAENLEAHAKRFSQAELKTLRARPPVTEELFSKISIHILELVASLFIASSNGGELPPAADLPYTFNFRYALAGYMLAVRWISVGGAKSVKPERIRNDVVDATFAAYATYFQGLLTSDVKAKELFEETKFVLNIFLSHPPPPEHLAKRSIAGECDSAWMSTPR
jgi:hypothetical protein